MDTLIDHELNVTIALIVGWKKDIPCVEMDTELPTMGWRRPDDLEGRRPLGDGYLPDYLNSLDAMHEAEKVLKKEQRESMIRTLHMKVTKAGFRSTYDADWIILHASARQRAEAFLRTVRPDLYQQTHAAA